MSVDHRKARASSSGTPGIKDVRTVVYQAALNNFPIVNFSVDIGKEGQTSAPPVAASMVLAGEAQTQAGAGRVNVDVTATDGQGGSLNFKGLHTGPDFGIGVMNVGLNFGGVHEAAGLIALNMSVYAPKYWRAPLASAGAVTGTIPARCLQLIELVRQDWKLEQERRTDSASKEAVAAIDEENTEPLTILKALLSASEDATIEQLDTALQAAGELTNKNFNLRLAHILTATTSNFWTTIQTLCSLFGFVYIPPRPDGADKYGKLISYEKIWENVSTLEVPTTGLRMNLGNVVVAPISHVAMARGASEGYKMGSPEVVTLFGESQEALVRYPVTPKAGRPMTIPMPDFISFAQPRPPSTASMYKGQMNLGNVGTDKEWWETKTKEVYDALLGICGGICKQTYLDVALADSSTSLEVPLDWSISPGMMVDVKVVGTNSTIFRGLLRAVSHTLSSQPPTASSALTFSHVQAGGYRIQ